MSLAWQLRSFNQWNLQSNTLIKFLLLLFQLLRTELIQRRDKKEWKAHSLQIYPREISVYFEPQQLSAYVKEILLISSTLELLWNKNDWWNIFHSLRYPSIFTQPLFKKDVPSIISWYKTIIREQSNSTISVSSMLTVSCSFSFWRPLHIDCHCMSLCRHSRILWLT